MTSDTASTRCWALAAWDLASAGAAARDRQPNPAGQRILPPRRLRCELDIDLTILTRSVGC